MVPVVYICVWPLFNSPLDCLCRVYVALRQRMQMPVRRILPLVFSLPGSGWKVDTKRSVRMKKLLVVLFSATLFIAGCGDKEDPGSVTETVTEAAEEAAEKAEEVAEDMAAEGKGQ